MKDFKSRSLSKDFMVITLFVIIISLFVSFWLTFKIYTNQKQAKTALLRTTADRVEDILLEDVKYVSYQMQYLSNLIAHKGATNKNISHFLKTFKIDSKINVAIAWNMFSWVDKKKRLTIDGTEGILRKPKDLSSRDYIPKTIETPGKLFIGRPIYGAVSNQFIIPAGMGVKNKRGKYVGSIVFGFDIKSLIYKLENAIGDQKIYFALVDENKHIIVESTNSHYEDKHELLKEVMANKGSESSKEVNTYQSLFNKDLSYLHYRELDPSINNVLNKKIGIIVSYNKEDSYNQMINLWIPNIVEILIIVAFFILLLTLVRRRILKPMVDLSQTADDILEKKENVRYPQKVPLEISKISDQLKLISTYEKDLLKSRERIASENAAKSKLINLTSHDLRNYIFGISGLSRLALEGKSESEIQDDETLGLVLEISKQSEELMYFVEDLLDTNYNESGNFSLKRIEKCDIATLIGRMITLNHNFAIQNKISLKSEITQELPHLNCDRRRMKQILGNLISNAIKYSKIGKEVVIKATHKVKENQICIHVIDNGIGMSEDEIKMALSGLGSDIDKSDLDKEVDSYGIGLPSVQQLVKLHKGNLEITSIKNKGTTVTVTFDIDNFKEEVLELSEGDEYNEIDDKRLANKSILIADDNIVNVKVICAILRRYGYWVKHVSNGKEALRELDKSHFDLVILDGEMPVMNGWDTAKKIREGKVFKNFKDYKDIPIVAFMGNDSKEILERNERSGMNAMISKASHPKDILDIVRNCLENKDGE